MNPLESEAENFGHNLTGLYCSNERCKERLRTNLGIWREGLVLLGLLDAHVEAITNIGTCGSGHLTSTVAVADLVLRQTFNTFQVHQESIQRHHLKVC